MRTNLTFDFIVDKERKSILIKREFDAPVSMVWDAYTKSEYLDQWWAPRPWKARTKEMDFRPGGQWLYAMVGPQGEEHWAIARYNAVTPQQSFDVQDAFTDAEGAINTSMPQANWKVTFHNQGDTTIVEFVITYEKLEDLEATIQMGFKEGLSMAMEQLDEKFAAQKK
ncbi:SRPBCC domain-containing protein [Chitinophaga sp. sic0106]|uniref:SRPBCC family protein n=1 Tax=Chitinophaga sp. sic0106 TaxID=2854785 RepID=UPI001C46C471|nr:SRPBCC domain-containing protein [Chitinophaga sp. sic0106]MBV7530160.1 SRPBCC domain-containing protein [Chitinophaga sp. sic0106]